MTEPVPGRFHVALDCGGRRVLDGWWDDGDVAEGKWAGYVEDHRGRADARVRLGEWHGGREWPLREWPASDGGGVDVLSGRG
ncbi:hypothetical protein [Streptomyces sp. NPDC050145]|uniref:hypothetical protein n=1 Tax=Streptomyces sp. NPDC050145 TaxID=3365602 RepID=UPI0037AF9046